MSEPNRCERCGGPLPAGPLGGACPRCMMELGVEFASGSLEDPDSTSATSPQTPRDPGIASRPTVIGRYRILRLIGEGGMGAVYEAEQDHPRRIVALKIIKPGLAGPELLRRFEQESHALGRLQHPGIAQIHEAGTADTGFGPQPYFAMEFIRGKTLKDYAEAQHLNTRQRLEMVSKIAEAVQHAHHRGLIHRDLKPVNIMVDEMGQPKILDFGVARATDSDAQATSQTDMGQLVGTLAYMSPEQVLADPLEIDTRSDVYALGVILYELLAGKMPYTISKKLPETIQAIREEDPAKLSAVSRTYRGDIETIVAKALEKDKTRRYGSAAELAADIQRYLKDEPIVARPPTTAYQLQKFARRNKALVAGVAAVLVVLVGGIVASTLQATRASRAEGVAVSERKTALAERDRANDNQRAEAQARVRETEQRQVAEAARVQADAQTLVAQQALSAAQVNLYFNNIALADRESVAGNVDRFLDDAPAPLRNWEWHYLTRLNHMEDSALAGHRDAILALVIDPDGKRLRTVSRDKTFKDWDIGTRKEVATGTFGGDFTGEFDPLSIMPINSSFTNLSGRLILSTNGQMLFSRVWRSTAASSGSKFWDLSTGKDAFSFPAVPTGFSLVTAYNTVALSPDGLRVVAVSLRTQPTPPGFRLQSWDIGTGLQLWDIGTGPLLPINGLIFSPDGARLAVVQNASTRIVNAATGEELVTLGNSQGISALAFSRDGATVAAGVPGGVRAWKTTDGQELWSISGGTVTQMTFDPGGRLLATALADRTIRILDSATGREDTRLAGHTGTIHALSFTPDGTQLVSAGDDKLVRVWNVTSLVPSRSVDVGRTGPVSSVQVSPDGHTLWIMTESSLKSWDSDTGQSGFERPLIGASFIPTGRVLLSGMDSNGDGTRIALFNTRSIQVGVPSTTDIQLVDGSPTDIQVVDGRTGREIAIFPDPLPTRLPAPRFGFRISPDGNRAAYTVQAFLGGGLLPESLVQGLPGETHIWDIASRKLLTRIAGQAVGSFQFSPNGKLAALGSGGRVDIFDTTTGRRLAKLDGAPGLSTLLFSPDGNRLAGARGRAITIWDVRTGAKLVSLPEASDTVASMAFSPDGTRLVSVSSDGEVRLWDPVRGKTLMSLRDSDGPYVVREVTVLGELGAQLASQAATSARRNYSISFSPDGRQITLTLTTVGPVPKGVIVRIATWDGTPRR